MSLSKRSVFEEPTCLISTDTYNELAIDQDVLDQICGIKKQLNVVTIAGLYRTGKSYLLTRLAMQYKGFPLGSTIESKTKGIWAWCVKHPIHNDQMLLLLDTEGLGDIHKGNENHDNQIFTLALLMSSTIIYNIFGAFDQNALNRLYFISDVSKNMKISTSNGELDITFPELILTLRDFTLDIETEGKEMTSDEYLEDCLRLQSGDEEDADTFNEPRQCVRKCFKKRKCFSFERPAKTKLLKKLEELQDEDLNEDFVKDTRVFTDYVHTKCEPLSLLDGTPVHGKVFASLVMHYVDSIRNGTVPSVESALKSMTIIENGKAVKVAVDTYIKEMNDKLTLPTTDEKTIRDVHTFCKDVAINMFKEHAVSDEDGMYEIEAGNKMEVAYEQFVQQNHAESERRCETALAELSASISDKIQRGEYAVIGGYKQYRADRLALEQKYFAMTHLGTKKHELYAKFTQLKMAEDEAIRKSDEIITQKEREAEVQRQNAIRALEQERIAKARAEEAVRKMKEQKVQMERQAQILKAQQNQQIQAEKIRLEALERSRIEEAKRREQENRRILEEKRKRDLANALREQEERERQNRIAIEAAQRRHLEELERQRINNENQLRIQQQNLRLQQIFNQQRRNNDDCILL